MGREIGEKRQREGQILGVRKRDGHRDRGTEGERGEIEGERGNTREGRAMKFPFVSECGKELNSI